MMIKIREGMGPVEDGHWLERSLRDLCGKVEMFQIVTGGHGPIGVDVFKAHRSVQWDLCGLSEFYLHRN